ncbi:MAG: hypothetical protein JNM25_10865 [Planctomycetes bacterium]|nr:hypothetical protein [Planctomycetota bacterium]
MTEFASEFAPDVFVPGAAAAMAPGLAVVAQRIGCRRDLAQELGCGESLGVDLAHAAVNTLLACGALPQVAALHVVAPADAELPIAIVAGITNACRAHGVPIVLPLAAASGGHEHIGLVLTGTVLGKPRAAGAPGDVVLALRGRGATDSDLATMLARADELGCTLGDRLANGDTVGATLLAPRPSQVGVVQQPLREQWPAQLLAVDGQALVPTLRRALPANVDVEWTFAGWRPPAPFAEWFPGPDGARRAAETTSFGCSMLVLATEAEATRWVKLCTAWNEPATPIGRLVAAGG